jgi:hypothetical protein
MGAATKLLMKFDSTSPKEPTRTWRKQPMATKDALGASKPTTVLGKDIGRWRALVVNESSGCVLIFIKSSIGLFEETRNDVGYL